MLDIILFFFVDLFRYLRVWLNPAWEPTQLEQEQFMQGYRTGFPLVGEPPVPQTHKGTWHYRRGCVHGRRDYIPGISWEDSELDGRE